MKIFAEEVQIADEQNYAIQLLVRGGVITTNPHQ